MGDTAIFADSLKSLQEIIIRVADKNEKYGLMLNTDKTKLMKGAVTPAQLIINNKQVQKVNSYTYLGTTINEEWDHPLEVRYRIEKARVAFLKMSRLFKNHYLNLLMKVSVRVFPVLLYEAESRTLTECTIRKLEAFEM